MATTKSRFRKEVPISKKLLLYRNGDKDFPPVEFVYNSYQLRTFDKMLEEVGRKVPPRNRHWGIGGTGVRTLWSADGTSQITTVEQMQAYKQDIAIVGGPEKFIPVDGGYENLEQKAKDEKEEQHHKRDEETEDVNYREVNKKRYGDQERSKEEKIYYRYKVPPVKKITIKRNKDRRFHAKQYVWKTKQVPNLEGLTEELRRLAPPKDGGPTTLYTMDGKLVEDLEQIEDGGTYVVAGDQPFDLEGSDFDPSDDEENRRNRRNGNKRDDKDDDDDGKTDSKGRQKTKRSGRNSDNSTHRGWKNIGKDEEPDWQKIDEKDRQFLDEYFKKQKGGEKRRQSQKVFNRQDQVKPPILVLYVFLNGDGQIAECVHLKPPQVLRGMPYILEMAAKRFTINPKCFCTLSGEEIQVVSDLQHRGAYVLVPWGENYRDSWFYLPKNAIDTSTQGDDEEQKDDSDDEKREGTTERRRSRTGSGDSRPESDQQRRHRNSKEEQRSASAHGRRSSTTRTSTKRGARSGRSASPDTDRRHESSRQKNTGSTDRRQTSTRRTADSSRSQETNPSTSTVL